MASYSKKKLKENEKRAVFIEKDSSREVQRIWKVNPSYKDINNSVIIARIITLGAVVLFFICAIYLLTSSLSLGIAVGLVFLIIFLLVFYDIPFYISSHLQNITAIKLFKDITFYTDQETIYLSNHKESISTGIKIFKIEVIPESIHASVNLFLKGLSEYKKRVSFTYQIIQTPLIGNGSKVGPLRTCIYFCIYHRMNGNLSGRKLKQLQEKMLNLGTVLKSNFTGNYHHFKISQLSGTKLVNALRIYFFKSPQPVNNELDTNKKYSITPQFLIRFMFLAFTIITSSGFLLSLGINLLIVFLSNIALFSIVVYLWWRELLSFITKSRLMNNYNIKLINPFQDITFFRFRGISDTIFAYINDKLLIGMKMFNLAFVFPPSYCRSDKFIQGIMNQKVSFGYTCINRPLSYEKFYKKGVSFLEPKTRWRLLSSEWRVQTKIDEINWLSMRSGIWNTILNLSASEFEFTGSLSREKILTIEERLEIKAQLLLNTFNINFFNYELVQLKNKMLISGLLCEILKTNMYNLYGSNLNYVMFQGKALIYLTDIVDELKKGITTRIPSEFNTPLHLENNIIIGKTINTEVLEEEMSFGFTNEQSRNILIVNGSKSSRELLMMKMVTELIKLRTPSIIFDFKGTWSRVITYFKGTPHEKSFLYFKLGSAFSLDPVKSDIPYDKDNVDFLNFMFDAYAMSFKRDQRTIDVMRTTILQNPDMDMTSLNLKLLNQNKWEKSRGSDTLISLFGDFTQQDEQYLHISLSRPTESITFKKFTQDNKTVIIDLSVSNDYKKQTFLTFLIVSKIIHYISSVNSKDYIPKILVVPHTDIFFDTIYLDRFADYGKINKFLDPLLEREFGFIFSANQAHYLHPNLMMYFENIVAFKTRDKRDIAALRNIMNLRELQGTGIYSRSRNELYQIPYLMNVKNDEGVVKRSDVYKPFPVRIQWEDLLKCSTMTAEEIISYMSNQGYNLKDTERKILDQVKKSLFEKDFGMYGSFIREIKQFLEAIKTVDQIGNLYEKKLKKELKMILYPKASKYFKSKMEIKNIRDKIFNLLIKHGYLVENHSKTASGSESIRTSYSVGSQYQKALEDEYLVKFPYPIETLEKESDIPFTFPEQNPQRKFIIQEKNLKKAIAREFSNFLYEVFTIYEYIKEGKYENALKTEHTLIHRFFAEVYRHYYNNKTPVNDKELQSFLSKITVNSSFPFKKEDLSRYLEHYQIVDFDSEDLKVKANEFYELISTFFDKLQLYIYNTEDDNEN
ncbi:MAG: hypothetical protein ACXAEX_01530 [Promethearchaeota archaeon]|jgi:hypothetical protein